MCLVHCSDKGSDGLCRREVIRWKIQVVVPIRTGQQVEKDNKEPFHRLGWI